MSDNDPHLSHPRPPLKQYKKKKRPRDDGGDEVVDEARTEKKRRKKHREESGAISTVSAPVVEGDLQTLHWRQEKKKKKKKKKKEKKHREHGEGGEPVLELVSAEPGAEKKKKKRKRDAVDDLDSAHETSELREDAPRERKKKKDKHAVAEIPETPASTLEAPTADMTLFPTHPFPNLSSYTSNEDVLRALQDLDVSKIAGVVKTLTDAADAANISMSMASGAFLPPHRRTLDLTGPSSFSDPHPGHAHLLANKWMSLVESEGLVYKKGKFSAIESKQVNEAVENYRTTRGLSEQDLNLVIFPSEEKKKDAIFWAEITNAVPLRPIIAVYHYVRRTYHPMKLQGKWQPEEDAKVIQAVASFGQKWEKVAKVVGRMATDCRDRYRNHIVNREKRSTGSCSPDIQCPC
ncbi:hypothetical protein C8R46DRAFT_1072067 [Mycena filopes]|nr:hypothetical protein C8R46DRAFT_1072067 [Mycena filopes]